MKQPPAEDLRPRDARAAAVGAQPLHRLRDGPRDDAVPRALRDRARGQEDERAAQGRNSLEKLYVETGLGILFGYVSKVNYPIGRSIC